MTVTTSIPLIYPADAALDAAQVGGKAASLARLGSLATIPSWFVVTPRAFEISLTADQKQQLQTLDSPAAIAQGMAQVVPTAEVIQSVQAAILARGWGERTLLAVRSSAVDEDGREHSFAGQLKSILGVFPDQISEAIQQVWASGFTKQVIQYRQHQGLDPRPTAPAVILQQMINSEVAGVAFGADPVSGRRSVVVISSVWGLGSSLVAGEVDGDTFHVDQQGQIIKKALGQQSIAYVLDPDSADRSKEKVKQISLPQEKKDRSTLTDAQIQAINSLTRRLNDHYGWPQDIEWAIAEDQLYLLQSRPITALPPDPEGIPILWDNSNISESYSGITTPLTFSFARRAYEEVYRQLCLILGVPRSMVADQGNVFRHMIGLIRGRVYYNLYNWYRTLALLPGFSTNQKFMEQMMGVKEGLPPELAAEIATGSPISPWQDRLRLAGTCLGLIRNFIGIDGTIRQFYARLENALRPSEIPLHHMRADQLVTEYRALEQQLLTRWDAPLINDLFAMICFGVLGKLSQNWCGDPDKALANQLLCGEGGMISTEPARRITEMGQEAAQDPDLIETLCHGDPEAIQQGLADHRSLGEQIEAYLDRFGDRCLEELKLESPTLVDDPLPLWRSIGAAGKRWQQSDHLSPVNIPEQIRKQAEDQVESLLAQHPIRRWIWGWVLGHTRARVRERENLRFERTRLFGRVRRIFLELGRRYQQEGILDQARDIFYLEVEETLGFVEGSTTCTDLRGLAAVRRSDFSRFEQLDPPADRFLSRGAVPLWPPLEDDTIDDTTEKSDRFSADQLSTLQGLGCCPGRVKGQVRVIRDPRGANLQQGEILVAERTDPGWVLLFPAAAGILVQRGSLLSHSAIVAREMGIPAIVSIPQVLDHLQTGQWVEMDGSTGQIRVINPVTPIEE